MIEGLIEWSARNKFLVIICTLVAIAAGTYALDHTPLDAIPDLSDVQVIVYTDWEGRSPDLIEDQITYPISSRFIAAPKVKFVRGESMFGKSFVYVIFEDGTDIYWARSRVIEYLNSVRGSLPEAVNPVIGPDATGVGWVYEYALVDESGKHNLAELRSFQDWNLRYALESVKGVAEIAAVGGFVKQYQVDLDPNALVAYQIPLSEIVSRIKASNGDVGGKVFEVATTEYYVRGRGYIKSIADIENVVLKVENGTPVYVKNVGTVHLGGDIRRGVAELDGKGEVVGGIVVMRYGENALAVIDGVKKKIEQIKSSLPEGVRIVPTYDRSELIRRAIATLREKLIEESIVVALVCIVFLWHVRSALVAIITLPIAILLSFVPMLYLHLTSNIMSLGGIAIAIGAMVDAAIIMVENAHKALEHFRDEHQREPNNRERVDSIIAAAKTVGRPLFFSLLVITVSFIPVFSLTAQEGRLFKPLAFTKTFSMFFASLLGVTLVPVLMTLLIRGKITPEIKNPLNQFLIWVYRPCVNFVLRYRSFTLACALLVLIVTVFPFRRLGSEFMPPLNEGTMLYMPTAVPGMSITEATRILQIQDRQLRKFPEVQSVFGKAGQAETSTDPAPLSMFETVVTFKPFDQWRPGVTWEKLQAEMNANIKTPGMANIFWMPIQTRTEMLTTGFRSVLGLKVFGADLGQIQNVAVQIERALSDLPDTRSVFAERTTGGYFLDFTVKREAAARYGLTVGDVNDVVETAIGGKTITTTVEGRERYPVNARYARDFRQDLDSLKRVLIATPTGAQVPISLVADIQYKTGPPSIRDENGQLVGFVFVDVTTSDIEGYVRKAAERLRERIQFPAGYYIQWAGQFQYLQAAMQRLKVVIPFTLLIIFVLLYLNTRSVVKTFIVLLTVPFSLVGAFWLLYLLGYNMSVAVWVGLIALAGLDAETGVVMLLYLDHAWEKFRSEGRMRTVRDLHDAVVEGAVQRIRPKIMTVCAIFFGLLPIMWSPVTQTGADVMKRIATPMIGGVVTSAILELLLYPVIYVIWRRRGLEERHEEEAAFVPSTLVPSEGVRRRLPRIIATILIAAALVYGANLAWHKFASRNTSGTPVATQTVNDLTVRVISSEGQLRQGGNNFIIEFRDSSGRPVDVGTVKFELNMSMPGMQMQGGGAAERTGTTGQYRAKAKTDMAGDWNARISYDGPRGKGESRFSLNVKQ
jgi:Cu(I)/Ag(I) efflux system membrane protein CusA/SilA